MSRRDHSLSVFSGTFWCAREPPGIVVTNPGASAAAIGGGDDFDACCLPPLLPASNGSSHGRRCRVHSSGHSRCDRPVSVINLIEGLCCPSSLPLTPLPLFPSRRGERRRGGETSFGVSMDRASKRRRSIQKIGEGLFPLLPRRRSRGGEEDGPVTLSCAAARRILPFGGIILLIIEK